MENTDNTNQKKNDITKPIDIRSLKWEDNITTIDLSDKEIKELADDIIFPENLYELNLSHNLLKEVPYVVLKLKHLKMLNVSHNSIVYFDDTPSFCHTIEDVDLSSNSLNGPPYWVWSETTEKLNRLNLSHNPHLTESLTNEYFKELIQYKCQVKEVDISNCRIRKDLNVCVLKLFKSSIALTAGVPDYTYSNKNNLIELPNTGFEEYCDIQKLYLPNTNIYTINSNIDIYQNLIIIDLSLNNITDFPKQFCNLCNLKICNLSHNKILYLPDEIHKMDKLRELHLNTNELCMLPESLKQMCHLKLLDLYDNHLSQVPEGIESVEQLDLALNYFDEPTDDDYIAKKGRLRMNSDRIDGRKEEVELSESEKSSYSLSEGDPSSVDNIKEDAVIENKNSSDEDWDSDEYWIPRYYNLPTPPTSQWMYYVKQMMEEGNFCPIDMHTHSVSDRITEERKYHPKEEHESEGQFDDYSGDDS